MVLLERAETNPESAFKPDWVYLLMAKQLRRLPARALALAASILIVGCSAGSPPSQQGRFQPLLLALVEA